MALNISEYPGPARTRRNEFDAAELTSGEITEEWPMSGTRLTIAALLFCMVNAVVFGIGIVTVLMVPALSGHAMAWIPTVVVMSFALSAPLSWLMAPRLRARTWRRQNLQAGL